MGAMERVLGSFMPRVGSFILPLILRAKENNRLSREVRRSSLVLKVPVPAVWGMGRSKASRVSSRSQQIRTKTSPSGFAVVVLSHKF